MFAFSCHKYDWFKASSHREFNTSAYCNTILGSGSVIFSQLTCVCSAPPLLHWPYFTAQPFPSLYSHPLVKLLSLMNPLDFALVCLRMWEERSWHKEKGAREVMMYVGFNSENPSEKGQAREHDHWAWTEKLHSHFWDLNAVQVFLLSTYVW